MIADWLGIGEWIRSEVGVSLFSIIHGVAFLWVAIQLRRAPGERLADELAADGPDGPGGAADPHSAIDRSIDVSTAAAAMGRPRVVTVKVLRAATDRVHPARTVVSRRASRKVAASRTAADLTVAGSAAGARPTPPLA